MDTTRDKDLIPTLSGDLNEIGVLAYVKPVATNKGPGYAICASDGTQLAIYSSRDAAFYAARQHDLEPVLIH